MDKTKEYNTPGGSPVNLENLPPAEVGPGF